MLTQFWTRFNFKPLLPWLISVVIGVAAVGAVAYTYSGIPRSQRITSEWADINGDGALDYIMDATVIFAKPEGAAPLP